MSPRPYADRYRKARRVQIRDFQPVFQYTIMEEVHTWFQETKLTQYEQMFLENGYDDLEVIAAITDDELREIGINLPGHRKKILLKASSLRIKNGMSQYSYRRYSVFQATNKQYMQLVYQNKPTNVPKTARMADKPSEEPLDSFSSKKKKKYFANYYPTWVDWGDKKLASTSRAKIFLVMYRLLKCAQFLLVASTRGVSST